jgi:hypothetical protein
MRYDLYSEDGRNIKHYLQIVAIFHIWKYICYKKRVLGSEPPDNTEKKEINTRSAEINDKYEYKHNRYSKTKEKKDDFGIAPFENGLKDLLREARLPLSLYCCFAGRRWGSVKLH